MRLIHTKTLEISVFGDDEVPPFAILSHTWEDEEVTLQEMAHPVASSTVGKKGYKKIQHCCSIASENEYQYAWIDTCCIDKTSSTELSEAINSMYRWYEDASICYAYLSDVTNPAHLSESRWFTRGWTLQELIAPSTMAFFDGQWNVLGTKESLRDALSARTGIPSLVLSGVNDPEAQSVADKMSWAAKRQTSRVEDRAYSLLGIFGINMPLIYGEGENAFLRLQEEILRLTEDHSIFAWESNDGRGGVLATSPDAFSSPATIFQRRLFSSSDTSITISSKGVHLSVPFIGMEENGLGIAVLHCATSADRRVRVIGIWIKDEQLTMETFVRVRHGQFLFVELSNMRLSQYPTRRICIKRSRISRRLPSQRVDESVENLEGNGKKDLSKPESFEWRQYQTREQELLQAAGAGQPGRVWLLLTQNDLEATGILKALTEAVGQGQQGVVRMLLPRSISQLNGHDGKGQTPLTCAAQYGRDSIAQLLIESGADLNAKNSSDETPIVCAIARAQEVMVQLLIRNGADISPGAKPEETPLWYAISMHQPALLKILLANGADPEDIGHPTQDSLDLAISRGFIDIVELLLENSESLQEKFDGAYASRKIANAAHRGDLALTQLLLSRGADIETRGESQRTPLIGATVNGHELLVKQLLARGAKVDARDGGDCTALMHVGSGGHWGMLELLLAHGADPNISDTGTWISSSLTRNRTILSVAVARGDLRSAELLLQYGADPNVYVSDSQTTLSYAALYSDYMAPSLILLLLRWGADPNVPYADGQTPLIHAIKGRHVEIVKLLLEKGADPKGKNNDGYNALNYSWKPKDGNKEQLEIHELLEARARTWPSIRSAKDKFGSLTARHK